MDQETSPATSSRGFRIGSIAGTTIHVEVSFLILVVFFILLNLEDQGSVAKALLWAPTLFLGVLLHEFGHAAVIALFGNGPSQISLSGFGGLTVNERQSTPWKEIVISAAGPLTSLAIGFLAGYASHSPSLTRDPMLAAWLPLLAWTNQSWAVFNLIPIFPLDGGQILRNLCSLVFSRRRALLISTGISMLLTAALAVYGLTHQMIFLTMLALVLLMQNLQVWNLIRKSPPPPPTNGPDAGI